MAADRTRNEVLSIFETRFDYLSARNILADCVKLAGLEPKDAFEAADLAAIAGVLPQFATSTEGLAEALTAAEPPAEEPKAEEPKAEEPPAEEPKAEEPKAEEKPAAAKKDAPKKDGGKKKKK